MWSWIALPALGPTLAVAIGGAAGSVLRFWVAIWAARAWGDSFPLGTLAINVGGSLVIGLFAAVTTPGGAWPAGASLRPLVMTGLCGGFTTFSAFSLQTFLLLREGRPSWAAANALLSVLLCIAAAALGWACGLRLR